MINMKEEIKNLKIELTLQEVDVVLQILQELPAGKVYQIMKLLDSKIQESISQSQYMTEEQL